MPHGAAPGPAAALAIEAHDLVKTYPGGVRALSGLSFSVPEGTVFGLLGPNGAGKSTTVKILTTLSLPDSGSARVAGHDVLRRPDRVRRSLGSVAQRSGAIPESTGREDLTLQGQLHGMPARDLAARVVELLDRFDLTEAADRPVRTYSGGMQRKLEIALGLVHRPRVLFLDEPTTGLDPEARSGMWDEISRLARDEGLSILLTTHYLDEADRLADRLAIVDRGAVVVEGSPEQLKAGLSGDTITVELPAAPGPPNGRDERARAALHRVPGLHDLSVADRWLRARAERGATAVPAVLAALDAQGITAVSVNVARPSLDEVYLRHAGRSFVAADTVAGEGVR